MENKFRSKQDIALHLDAVREASNIIEIAVRTTMDIVRKFDGKQFTRRITNLAQKAVDDALGGHLVSVVFELTPFHFGVEFYLVKRSYMVEGYPVYFDGEVSRSLICWDGSRYALQASGFQKSAENLLRSNSLLVYKYADALEHFDEYRTAYADAVRSLQQTCGAINPLFTDHMVYTQDTRVSRAWMERAEESVA